MRFATEFEQDLVPEWRAKYFDYKQGKKKVKAVARALRNVQKTPMLGGLWPDDSGLTSPDSRFLFTYFDFDTGRSAPPTRDRDSLPATTEAATTAARTAKPTPLYRASATNFMHTPPLPLLETQPLKSSVSGQGHTPKNHGSFLDTTSIDKDESPLKFPEPAIRPGAARSQSDADPGDRRSKLWGKRKTRFLASDPYQVGSTQAPQKNALSLPKHRFDSRRLASSLLKATKTSPFSRRMLSSAGIRSPQIPVVPLGAYRGLDSKQDDFFGFLDKELDKVENFYRSKEEESSKRLEVLKAQLHEMSDRRLEEDLAAQKNQQEADNVPKDSVSTPSDSTHDYCPVVFSPREYMVSWKSHLGRATEPLKQIVAPSRPSAWKSDAGRDYVSRMDQNQRHNQNVSYRQAKPKLKLALREFYRGLELTKSYALVNRTAFRKINKKYDTAVSGRLTGRYVAEKVNKTHLVTSDIIDSCIVAVEDLYTRYFERGDHEIAVRKLRSKVSRTGDFSRTSMRNGIWLTFGAVFGFHGLGYAVERLGDTDETRWQTPYLLQLYGGYLLGVLTFLLFVLDCRIWTCSKINYAFIFEFDSRHVLDWRQLAELPCFFLCLEGVIMWLNFRPGNVKGMFIYWPVVLITTTLIILCIPLRISYHRSRKWLGYSHFRLLLAGLLPVEFRDFFIGDMYCSLAYTMGNMELFFCLYAEGWQEEGSRGCNSTQSKLLGFFACVPAIWRTLQCLSRYNNSRSLFPHLANIGKYTFSVLFQMSLSLYRIKVHADDPGDIKPLKVLFILFATINAIYSSIWDIGMDWSLGNPYAAHPFLRDTLGFHRTWVYYLAMALDPPLRFTWLAFAFLPSDAQQSNIASFLVALAEVVRRAIWAIFRVENEHCANVGQFRASRDVALPYSLESSPRQSSDLNRPATAPAPSRVDIEQPEFDTTGSLRHRRTWIDPDTTLITRGLHRVGAIITQAHTQDFERRNRASTVRDGPESLLADIHDDSSDEDDDNDDRKDDDVQDMLQAQVMLDRAQI